MSQRTHRCGHALVLLRLLVAGGVLGWIAYALVRDIRNGTA